MQQNNSDYSDFSEINNNNDQEYEVEKIVDRRISQKKVEYLIRWKGYTSSADTWETLENLIACDECINNYLSQESENIKKRNKEEREKSRVTSVQFGIINEASEISYHVITSDGKEKDLTSKEMRMNYPFELLKFLEKTSFKGTE